MSQPIVARYLVFLYFFIELDVPTNSAAQTPFLCLHRNVRDQFQPILSFSALHNFYKHPSVIYQKLENNVFFINVHAITYFIHRYKHKCCQITITPPNMRDKSKTHKFRANTKNS